MPYNTLYTCLTTLSRLVAPIMPFISEEVYTNLVGRRSADQPDSVHLADWPVADESVIDEALGTRTNLAMRLASLGRSARSAAGIKVRQPLNALIVELNSPNERETLELIAAQLKDELNVRDVRDTSESDSLMAYQLRPNLPVLGPKYGRQVNDIRNLLNDADASAVAASVRAGENVQLGDFELTPDEILVDNIAAEGYAVESDGTYTVGISTEVTPELRAEGYVRDIAHIVQNMRKKRRTRNLRPHPLVHHRARRQRPRNCHRQQHRLHRQRDPSRRHQRQTHQRSSPRPPQPRWRRSGDRVG